MSDVVISVESLGKKYRIRHEQRERYTALRDVLTRKAAAPFQWLKQQLNGHSAPTRPTSQSLNGSTSGPPHLAAEEDFWALKGVSFEVKQGEVLGIIGRNGAGKSTLLKILSQITEPTEGRVRIKGRVVSLLEVGTGFHPELTGRENIFLNGAVLGMGREEIRRKFDDIVEFAETERFLDTPVKRYSSGMYVRLAFAVAAHLEPEILIIDEVLAVGDVVFQKKCMGKMQDVSRGQGRTVLFVSHNVAAVKSLCQTGILLEQGRVEYCGRMEETVERYLCGGVEGVHDGVIPDALPRQYATGEAKLRRVQIVDAAGTQVQSVLTGGILRIRVEWEVIRPLSAAIVEIGVMDSDGRQVTQSCSTDGNGVSAALGTGDYEIWLSIDEIFFPGRYSLLAGIHKKDGTTVDFVERALDFEILNTGKDEPNHYRWSVRGYLRPKQEWQGPFHRTAETSVSSQLPSPP